MKYLTFSFLVFLSIAGLARAQTIPSVNLIWSANTYTPPLYRGHSMATPQSQVKLVALASNWGIDPVNLDYVWKRNGQTLLKSSGLGRNTLSFTAGNAGEVEKLGVSVTSPNRNITQEQTISIPVINPSLSVYQNESLTGVNYAQAIGASLQLGQPEINLLAEPYFFPMSDVLGKKIDYRWQLNGQKVVPDAGDNRYITFAAPSGTSGENTISLAAESLNTIFQNTKKQFQIVFGGTQNFNF